MNKYFKGNISVSVIIPSRNEEKYIGKCLDSLINQDYPKEDLEILIIDGDSKDKTKQVVKRYAEKYSFIKILDNPNKYTPFGLNIGIKKSQGKIIIRMDAHAGYNSDYISKCVTYLRKTGADNVGGVLKTVALVTTYWAKTISMVLSNKFGAGSSVFRTGSKEVKEVDTVFGGCYRKEIFQKVGMFNENLVRSQDLEFNKRIKKSGGKIILVPDIVAIYHPQSTFIGFLKHNFIDGFWTIYPLRFNLFFFSFRHLIPLFFVLALLFGITTCLFGIGNFLFLSVFTLYFLLNLYFSLKLSNKYGSYYLPFLMASFFNRHFFYGIGSLWGLIKVILDKYGRKKTKRN